MSLRDRLHRLEDRAVSPPVRAADARKQGRICANLQALITRAPLPSYTAAVMADEAILAAYVGSQGAVVDLPADYPAGLIDALLYDLGHVFTVLARLAAGQTLAAWANTRVAAGRD
jgi:hypothetical protein